MDETDRKIKNIWAKAKKRGSGMKSEQCPDDELLFRYLNGALKSPEWERIERHLPDCGYCLDLVLLHKRIREDESPAGLPDAPVLWKEKAKNIFTGPSINERAGLFDVVLQFTKEAIEVISNPGSLSIAYGPTSGALRSANKILSPNLIILSKTFYDLESELEVESVDNRHVNMKIRTNDIHTKAPVDSLRISLFNPLRELVSYITENGEVCFGNLNYGEYKIAIIRDREEVGHISLNITLNIN